jgi:hypothetical protein
MAAPEQSPVLEVVARYLYYVDQAGESIEPVEVKGLLQIVEQVIIDGRK